MANMCQPCDSKNSSPSAPQGLDLERLFNLKGKLWNKNSHRVNLELLLFCNLVVARLCNQFQRILYQFIAPGRVYVKLLHAYDLPVPAGSVLVSYS